MKIRLALVFLFPLLLSGCVGLGYSDSYNYRLTVNIDTPEGLKSGSTVRKVSSRDNTTQYSLIAGMRGGCHSELKGEAVVVDLGTRGKVFALLDNSLSAHQIVQDSFPLEGGGPCLKNGIKYYSNLKGKTEVPPFAHPMMVTFTDLSDPTSVKYVYGIEQLKDEKGNFKGDALDKQVKEDNFAALFGEGVKLHSITIEMTDDAVTEGIEEVLPWLPEYQSKLFDGRKIHTIEAENRLANSLGLGSFAVGTIIK